MKQHSATVFDLQLKFPHFYPPLPNSRSNFRSVIAADYEKKFFEMPAKLQME